MPFDPRYMLRYHSMSWRYAHHTLFPPQPPTWFPSPSKNEWRWTRGYAAIAVFWVLYNARTELPVWLGLRNPTEALLGIDHDAGYVNLALPEYQTPAVRPADAFNSNQ